MDFAEPGSMSVPSPLPVAVSDSDGIQEVDTDDSYTLTNLERCDETQDQNPVNAVADLFEGLDYDRPSTSRCKTNANLDRLCENGVYEYRYDDEYEDIQKFYYMTEDNFAEVLTQLEEEIEQEEQEAQDKVAATEEMIKEMEQSASNFVHVRELIKKRDKHSKAAIEVREEKERVRELKKQLAMANKASNMFCCFVCCKVFLDEEEMRQHVSVKHLASKKEYKYRCPSCYRVFMDQQKLSLHIVSHNKEELRCSVCERSFKEPVSLKIHMSKIHGQSVDGEKIDKTIVCKCGQMFGIIEELKRHEYHCVAREKVRERRRRVLKELDEMSSITPTSSAPGSDVASSSGSGNVECMFECPMCHRKFSKNHHLRRHVATHSNTEVSCSICGRSYRDIISLQIHMSKEHSQSLDGKRIEKNIACECCGQMFGIIEELKRHKYYCGSRDKIAERRKEARQELDDAMSTITSVSGWAESVISSSSGAASTVSIGSASGRPVKDKSCPFCFLVCASMQSRRRHIERKHPEKLNDLEVDTHGYVKVVTPALPYACDICSKTFASHASMITHKKRIHENKNNHECTTCGRSYPLASELRKHIKRVHEKDLDYVISQKVALSG